MNNKSTLRFTGILLLIEAFLIFVPVIVLGAAINRPANLSEPASVNLPLVLSQAGAVKTGYFVYLIYSALFWPVAYMTARVVAGKDELPPMLKIAAGFGVASSVARTLGIVRWLSVMPVLAKLYANGTTESQATISIIFDAFNSYGGTIGEALGVGLFAGLWLVLVSIAMFRSAEFPKWLSIFGLVAAFTVTLQSIELFGIDLGALISVLVTVLHLWLMAAGGYLVYVSRNK